MRCADNFRAVLQQWAWNRAKALKAKVHDINYLFWECTLRCNLNCRHCGSDCAKDEQMPELSAERVIEVFRDVALHYDARKIMVAVTGGEPLLRSDLFDVMREVRAMGFPWGMVTNGMLVNESIIAKCREAGMRTATVSIDGIGEVHNWLRCNKKSFKNATRALKLLTEGGFDVVDVITCVHRGNVDQLDEIYDLIRNLGAFGWRIFTIFPKGRAACASDLAVDAELLVRVLDFVKTKRGENCNWPINYSEEGYLGSDWDRKVRDLPFYCGAGINVGGLLCDGSYSACPSLSREWIQGHVDELSFSEAWETRYQNMRNRRWMQNNFCGSCPDWKNCQASSLHLWDWSSDRPSICHLRMLESLTHKCV